MFDLNSFQFAEPFLKSFRTRGALLYGVAPYVLFASLCSEQGTTPLAPLCGYPHYEMQERRDFESHAVPASNGLTDTAPMVRGAFYR